MVNWQLVSNSTPKPRGVNMRDTRIQKAMADCGLCSRRQAEQIILEKRVQLNGRPVTVGDKMDIREDVLSVDGNRIVIQRKKEFYYYMLNKPRGYITTSSDDRGRRTVLDLVKDIPARVYPVGRLDKDSEGLLFFTNDGDFANLLTHPSHQVSKLYRVTVRPAVNEEQLIALTSGVYLDDGTKTLPSIVRVVTNEDGRSVMELSIKEGKNRQVRRMCEAVGLEVARLKRISIGAVKLGMLAPGKIRELKPSEIIALKAAATKSTGKARKEF